MRSSLYILNIITHAYTFWLHCNGYCYFFKDEQEPEGEDLVDSEEYEEDEEEERLRKKRKKDSRYGGFIIDEAEVYIWLFYVSSKV